MGQEILSLRHVESKRVLWLLGILFGVILVFQYSELPYRYVISPLVPSSKVPNLVESSFQTEIIGNTTTLGEVKNSTSTSHIQGMANNNTGKIVENGNNDLVAEKNGILEKNLELQEVDDASNASSSGNKVELNENVDNLKDSDNQPVPEDCGKPKQIIQTKNDTACDTSKGISVVKNNTMKPEDKKSYLDDSPSTSPPAPPVGLSQNLSVSSTASLKEKDGRTVSLKNDKPEQLQIDLVFPAEKGPKVPASGVYTISEMKNLLIQSYASHHAILPQWSSSVDQELEDAKLQIQNAPVINNDPSLYAPLYHNVSMFRRSYELMEETLKVYIYKEGERPILHQPPLQGIYASEGWFMKHMEANKKFVTKNPRKAHLFYLPFSSRALEETLYVRDSHSHKNLIQFLKNYLDLIGEKYPFWNRTGGADHFLVACHDWAPSETRRHMAKCIRALCNADTKEGFVFGKDVSLPETYVRMPRNPLRDVGGNSPSRRPILAFFAGNMHGYLRPILLQHWQDKDPDMKIFGLLPKDKGKKKKDNYVWHMKNSKYCICAKGYEVNSPRVVEAIFYECVPVIISDNFVPPFFEVLNWESFAVFVLEKDIPNLKNILLSISEKRYRSMQMRVKRVQQHFLWHSKPVKYDIFHMILHSVWYNRLYQIRPR